MKDDFGGILGDGKNLRERVLTAGTSADTGMEVEMEVVVRG